ncbi:MAG: hypothetical protein ISR65_03080 [Bacteriovoracaceae bacterium]|nr:hypothetical protein [Bacteriovoracaceae bacterium]
MAAPHHKFQQASLRHKYKTYNLAVTSYFEDNLKAFHRLKNSKDLSYAEKTLLEVRLLLQKQAWTKSLELLTSHRSIQCSFLKGEYYLLLGFVYRSLAQWQKCIIATQSANINFVVANDKKGQFLSNFNLSAALNRVGMLEVSNYHLEHAKNFAEAADEKVLVYRAYACKQCKEEDYIGACSSIESALALKEHLKVSEQLVLDTIACDIFFRAKKIEKATQILKVLKASGNNPAQSRALFDWHLLKVYNDDILLDKPPQRIEDNEEYVLKWGIISSLQNKNLERAKKIWDKLSKKIPEIYKNDLTAVNSSDNRSLFFKCVQKLNKAIQNEIKLKKTMDDLNLRPGSKLYILYNILKNTTKPLRKEDLIEDIWGGQYDPQFNSRFYKLIERLKKLTKGRIVNQDSSYMLKSMKGL